jgi:uncharacterized phage-associated protein
MSNAHDVAAYILEKLGNMSTMKLQKLCYYSQGWHLAWRNEPLFPERIESWRMGPVVRELYTYHRLELSVDVWPRGNSDALTPTQKAIVDSVLDSYGGLTGIQLSDLTHAEEPWLKARGGVAPSSRSTQEISQDSMREYFAALGGAAR